MAEQTTKPSDTAVASTNGKATTVAPASGTPAGLDWESEANPYKKRFAGEQRAKAQLQSRVAQLEQAVTANQEMAATVKRLEGRMSSVEDLAAELHDSRAQTAEDGQEEDLNPRSSPKKAEQIRQRRAQESHVERVKRVYNVIQNGWIEGMDPNDSRLARVRALYQGAVTDMNRSDDLYEAVELFTTVANEARAAAASTASAKTGDIGKGTKVLTAEVTTEDADGDDEEPEEDESPRERVAKSGVTAGQGADGKALNPADRSKLKPYDLFARSHRGEGYTPPAR